MFSSEDRSNVVSFPYEFKLHRNTLHIRDIHSTQRLYSLLCRLSLGVWLMLLLMAQYTAVLMVGSQ
jgi:hypothetical protein